MELVFDNIHWIVLAIVAFFAISIYNKLVALKNRFKNAFAQIDVQLQQRHDLIPNLVETAKAYMAHEAETLEKVIQARNQAQSAQNSASKDPANGSAVKKLGMAEGMLNGALANFFALQENYPDLKADGTMLELMENLKSTEAKVGFARQGYNDSVMTYMTYKESFPNNIFAGIFGFKEAELFEVQDESVKAAPKVSF